MRDWLANVGAGLGALAFFAAFALLLAFAYYVGPFLIIALFLVGYGILNLIWWLFGDKP